MPTLEDLRLTVSADPTPAVRYFRAIRDVALATGVSVSQAGHQAAAGQQAMAQAAAQAANTMGRAANTMGEAAEGAADQVGELAQATQEWNDLVQEVLPQADHAAEGLEGLGDAAGDAAEGLGETAEGAEQAGDALDKLEKPLTTSGSSFKNLEQAITQAANKLNKSLRNFEESALGLGAAAASIFLAMGGMVKVFADFEAVMYSVQTISHATAEQMDALGAKALQLGADTKFSAKEAADAFFELSKAGYTVDQQMASIDGVMALAAAGSLKVGEAAEISSGILHGFGMEAAEAGKMADQLAQAANSSAVDVAEVAETMRNVAPVAKASNQSLEEMMGTVALLGDRLIKGGRAGTAMAGILTRLQAPVGPAVEELNKLGISVADSGGKMLSLAAIVDQFRDKTAKMTEVDRTATLAKIVGQEHLSEFLALMGTSSAVYQNYIRNQDNATGAAKAMSDGINRGLTYQLEQLKGSIETLAIRIGGDLAPVIGKMNDALTTFVNLLGMIPAPIRVVFEGLAAFAGIAFTLSAGLGALKAMLPMLLAGFSALTGPIGLTILGISAAAVVIAALVGSIKAKTAATAADATATNKQIDTVNTLTSRFEELNKKTKLTKDEEAERHAILTKLEGISPDLVTAYNAEGEATRVNTERLADFNTELREKLRLQQQEVANTFETVSNTAAQAAVTRDEIVAKKLAAEARAKELKEQIAKSEAADKKALEGKPVSRIPAPVGWQAGDSLATHSLRQQLKETNEATKALGLQKVAQDKVVATATAARKTAQDAVWDASGRKRPGKTKTPPKTGNVTGAGGEKLTGYDLIKAQHEAGLLTDAAFIEKARAAQRAFNKDSKEYLDIAKGIADAERKIADAKKQSEQQAKQAAAEAQRVMRARHEAALAAVEDEQDEGVRLGKRRQALNNYLAELNGDKTATDAEKRRVKAELNKVDATIAKQPVDVQAKIAAAEQAGITARRERLRDTLKSMVQLEGMAAEDRLKLLGHLNAETARVEAEWLAGRRADNAQRAADATKLIVDPNTRTVEAKRLTEAWNANDEQASQARVLDARREGQATLSKATIAGLETQVEAHRDKLSELLDNDQDFVFGLGEAVRDELAAIAGFERQVAEERRKGLRDAAQALKDANPEAWTEIQFAKETGTPSNQLSASGQALDAQLNGLEAAAKLIGIRSEATIGKELSGVDKKLKERGKQAVLAVIDGITEGIAAAARMATMISNKPLRGSLEAWQAGIAVEIADVLDSLATMSGNVYAIGIAKVIKLGAELWDAAAKETQRRMQEWGKAITDAVQAARDAYTTAIDGIRNAFTFDNAALDLQMGDPAKKSADKVAAIEEQAQAYLDLADGTAAAMKAEQDVFERTWIDRGLTYDQHQKEMTDSTKYWANQRQQYEVSAVNLIKQAQQELLNNAATDSAMSAEFYKKATAAKSRVTAGFTPEHVLKAEASDLEMKRDIGGFDKDPTKNAEMFRAAAQDNIARQAALILEKLEGQNPDSPYAIELRNEYKSLQQKSNQLSKEGITQARDFNTALSNLSGAIGDKDNGIITRFKSLGAALVKMQEWVATKAAESTPPVTGAGSPGAVAQTKLDLSTEIADWNAAFKWANRWETSWEQANAAGQTLKDRMKDLARKGADQGSLNDMADKLQQLREGAWYHLKSSFGGDTAFTFSKGGIVPGSGDRDSVPALLTPGEMVLPKALSQRIQSLAFAGSRLSTSQVLNSASKTVAVHAEVNLGGVRVGSEADARTLAREVAPEIARLVREQIA